jgi:hypothetical protein
MSFFQLSTGQAVQASGEFDSGGGAMEPLPEGTQVLAMVDQAKWDAHEGEYFVSLRWTVAMPEEYKNRKIFQKIKVKNQDADKRDKALMMLAAIDANAGGQIMALGAEPEDADLAAALLNRPMVLKLGMWEMTNAKGEAKSGNWVQKVAPRKKGAAAPAATPAAPAPRTPAPARPVAPARALAPAFADLGDDIPFN